MEYGSTKSQLTSEYDRGRCINCHWPYRWNDDDPTVPDPANYPISGLMLTKYPKRLIEQYDITKTGKDPDDAEDLCYTCHNGLVPSAKGDFPVKDIKSQFEKISHMPVTDSQQISHVPGTINSVECADCHEVHQANSQNLYKGVLGIDRDNNSVWVTRDEAAAYPDNQLKQYQICLKCHGDNYETYTGKAVWDGQQNKWISPLASNAIPGNKRKQFNPALNLNGAFHPIIEAGQNKSWNLNEQLQFNLTGNITDPADVDPVNQVIDCTDCHNNDAADNQGRARNYTGPEALGPHGSNYPSIRRGNYWTGTSYPDRPEGYDGNNFSLCFKCHDQWKLAEAQYTWDGARTNFYGGSGDENLHYRHLQNAQAVCKNCHYNIHSNYFDTNDEASIPGNPSTQYRIDNTLYTNSLPTGINTHLINFSPDVLPLGTREKAEWWANTTNGRRRCYLNCHYGDGTNSTMNVVEYQPPCGDDPMMGSPNTDAC